jgi:hypothetical protein
MRPKGNAAKCLGIFFRYLKEKQKPMKTKRIVPVVGIGLILAGAGSVALMSAQSARSAAKSNALIWTKAESQLIAACRAEGQAGLDRLREEKAAAIQRLHNGGKDKDALRVSALLDAVSQQKDSAFSGLYWHTDLDTAKRVAQTTGRPILSLRLLGKLTDERSCANSRFFRSVLYPNTKVADYLRNNFVLHWSSERPVPLVTIDYGDGRRIETTLTGNSIHYILAADGTPVDALPGLYSPAVFLYRLQQAHGFVASTFASGEQRISYLKNYHRQAVKRLNFAALAENR